MRATLFLRKIVHEKESIESLDSIVRILWVGRRAEGSWVRGSMYRIVLRDTTMDTSRGRKSLP